MSRVDDTIASVAYIFDMLMAYRDIVETGSCNDCMRAKSCEYLPKLGQMVRYNCPFYERKTYKTGEPMSDLIDNGGYRFWDDDFSLQSAYEDCKSVFDGITDDNSFQECDTGLILYHAHEIMYALKKALLYE